MTREQMEFLISQYLDGTISREDELVVRELLATSEEAQGIAAEYEKLDQFVKAAARPVPGMNWEKVGEAIGAAVDEQAEVGAVSEEDEFAISEYIDGSLSADERGKLERRMEAEPALRTAAKEYLSLDRAMKQTMPMPAIRWEVLAERLSESIDAGRQRERMFIGNWMKQPMRLAAAAIFIIGLGLALLIVLSRGGPSERAVVDIKINQVEPEQGPSVAEVDFDMSPSLAQSGTDFYSHGDVVAMPVRLDVAISRPILNDGPGPF
jgi:anti-sigma factor RsiW